MRKVVVPDHAGNFFNQVFFNLKVETPARRRDGKSCRAKVVGIVGAGVGLHKAKAQTRERQGTLLYRNRHAQYFLRASYPHGYRLGLRHVNLLVIHRAAYGCWRPADVQNQLGDAFDVLHGELRVDAPLKSVPRIGGEVVTPRPTRHRLGPPKRGLNINVLRVIRHRGGVSPHDPGQRLYLRVIGNDADLLIQCHGVAV